MRQSARLAIGAVALVAGVAIFWISISQWTYDRIYARDGLASACLHDGDRLLRDPQRFRAYLAATVAREAGIATHPPTLRARVAEMLIERFGFLYVPEADYVHLIETMRVCGEPPAR